MPQLEKQILSSKDKQRVEGTTKFNDDLWPTTADYVPTLEDKPKINVGKYKPHLVTPALIEAVARVREYGVTKYGGENGWKMMSVTDYLDAMLRHADACRNDPTARDEESGVLHIAQVACNCMFLLELMGEPFIPENWTERLDEVRQKYGR
jgi:hypothetical protein